MSGADPSAHGAGGLPEATSNPSSTPQNAYTASFSFRNLDSLQSWPPLPLYFGGVPSTEASSRLPPSCPAVSSPTTYYQRLLSPYDLQSVTSSNNNHNLTQAPAVPWPSGSSSCFAPPMLDQTSASSSYIPVAAVPSAVTPLNNVADLYNAMSFAGGVPRPSSLPLGSQLPSNASALNPAAVLPHYSAVYQQQLLAAVASSPMMNPFVGLQSGSGLASALSPYTYLIPAALPYGQSAGNRSGLLSPNFAGFPPSTNYSMLNGSSPGAMVRDMAMKSGSESGLSSNAVLATSLPQYNLQSSVVGNTPDSASRGAEIPKCLANKENSSLNSSTVTFDERKLLLRKPIGDARPVFSETGPLSSTLNGRTSVKGGVAGTRTSGAAVSLSDTVPVDKFVTAETTSLPTDVEEDNSHFDDASFSTTSKFAFKALLPDEREGWASPIRLEELIAEAHLLKSASSVHSVKDSLALKCCKGRLPARFQSLKCAASGDPPAFCAVCRESTRPLDLCLLGDVLVVCKDCGLTVHRRCYGVQRTLVGCNAAGRQWFLCSVCRCRRERRLESGTPDVGLISCVICGRSADDTAAPQAFKRMEDSNLGQWIHVYCALLSKDYVQVRDLKWVNGISWLKELPCASTEIKNKVVKSPVAEVEVKEEEHMDGSSVVRDEKPNAPKASSLSSSSYAVSDNAAIEGGVESEASVDSTEREVKTKGKLNSVELSTCSAGCVFCGSPKGHLFKCHDTTCTAEMHVYCLRERMYQREQEEKNPMTAALTVSLEPFDTESDSKLSQVCVFCPDHVPVPQYCVCRKPFVASSDASVMVGCDVCGDWLHGSCISQSEVEYALQNEYYQCSRCRDQNGYFLFFDRAWATLPLQLEDIPRCRDVLAGFCVPLDLSSATNTKLETAMSCMFSPHAIIPSHVVPLPFPDMLLLASAWQWRTELLLLADRIVFAVPQQLKATGVARPPTVQTNVTKKVNLNKKTSQSVPHETESRIKRQAVLQEAQEGVGSVNTTSLLGNRKLGKVRVQQPSFSNSSVVTLGVKGLRGVTKLRGNHKDAAALRKTAEPPFTTTSNHTLMKSRKRMSSKNDVLKVKFSALKTHQPGSLCKTNQRTTTVPNSSVRAKAGARSLLGLEDGNKAVAPVVQKPRNVLDKVEKRSKSLVGVMATAAPKRLRCSNSLDLSGASKALRLNLGHDDTPFSDVSSLTPPSPPWRSVWSYVPLCSLKDIQRLLTAAERFPVAFGDWIEELGCCVARCERWLLELRRAVSSNERQSILDCLMSHDPVSLRNYLKVLKAEAKLSREALTGSAASSVPIPVPSVTRFTVAVVRRPMSTVSPSLALSGASVRGGLAMLTVEAVSARIQAVIHVFLQEATPLVLTSVLSDLSIPKLRKIVAEVERVPELQSLKTHPVYLTAQQCVARVHECQLRAKTIKSEAEISLDDIAALLHVVRTELPGDHGIDLFNLPELHSRGTALESQIEWRNLRSMRDVLAQLQHLPLTSAAFSRLKDLVTKLDGWRKDYQRFVSLVKAVPLSDGYQQSDSLLPDRRNVVVSGQSGFLKDLFSKRNTHDASDSGHLKQRVNDGGAVHYTQLQTLVDALELYDKGMQFNVDCEELAQLQEWITQCTTWMQAVCKIFQNNSDDSIATILKETDNLVQSFLNKRASASPQQPQPAPATDTDGHITPGSGTNDWDIAGLEHLLRRKAEFPLAVPASLVGVLQSRIHELKSIESRVSRCISTTTERCSMSKKELERSIDDAERLGRGIRLGGFAPERASRLERCHRVLVAHLDCYLMWEAALQTALRATDELLRLASSSPFSDGDDANKDPNLFCLETAFSNQCAKNRLAYPPLRIIESPTAERPIAWDLVDAMKNSRYAEQFNAFVSSSLPIMTNKISGANICDQKNPRRDQASCCTKPGVSSYEKDAASQKDPDVIDDSLFTAGNSSHSIVSGLNTVDEAKKNYFTAVESEAKNFLLLCQSLARYFILVAIQFLVLTLPSRVREAQLYHYLTLCLPDLLGPLVLPSNALQGLLLPSCRIVSDSCWQTSNSATSSPNQSGKYSGCGTGNTAEGVAPRFFGSDVSSNPDEEESSWCSAGKTGCSYFLVDPGTEFLNACIRRLLTLWALKSSDVLWFDVASPVEASILERALEAQNAQCVRAKLTRREPLWLLPEFLPRLDKKEKQNQTNAVLALDSTTATVSLWHLKLFHMLKGFQMLYDTGMEQSCHGVCSDENVCFVHFTLEKELTERLARLTWAFRSQCALDVIRSSTTPCFAPRPTLNFSDVFELVQEYESWDTSIRSSCLPDASLDVSSTDTKPALRDALGKNVTCAKEWFSRARVLLSGRCASQILAPQLVCLKIKTESQRLLPLLESATVLLVLGLRDNGATRAVFLSADNPLVPCTGGYIGLCVSGSEWLRPTATYNSSYLLRFVQEEWAYRERWLSDGCAEELLTIPLGDKDFSDAVRHLQQDLIVLGGLLNAQTVAAGSSVDAIDEGNNDSVTELDLSHVSFLEVDGDAVSKVLCCVFPNASAVNAQHSATLAEKKVPAEENCVFFVNQNSSQQNCLLHDANRMLSLPSSVQVPLCFTAKGRNVCDLIQHTSRSTHRDFFSKRGGAETPVSDFCVQCSSNKTACACVSIEQSRLVYCCLVKGNAIAPILGKSSGCAAIETNCGVDNACRRGSATLLDHTLQLSEGLGTSGLGMGRPRLSVTQRCRNGYLHRDSPEAYRMAQQAATQLFLQKLVEEHRAVSELLTEKPVLCTPEHPYCQLLGLRRELLEWAVVAVRSLLRPSFYSLMKQTDLELQLYGTAEKHLSSGRWVERLMWLEEKIETLRQRYQTLFCELQNTQAFLNAVCGVSLDDVHSAVCSVGAQPVWSHLETGPVLTGINCDFVGGFLGEDIRHRLLTLRNIVEKTSNEIQSMSMTSGSFLHTCVVWNRCVAPYFDAEGLLSMVKQQCEKKEEAFAIGCSSSSAIPSSASASVRDTFDAADLAASAAFVAQFTATDALVERQVQLRSSAEHLIGCVFGILFNLFLRKVYGRLGQFRQDHLTVIEERCLLCLPIELVSKLNVDQINAVCSSLQQLPLLHISNNYGLVPFYVSVPKTASDGLVINNISHSFQDTTSKGVGGADSFTPHESLLLVLPDMLNWLVLATDVRTLHTSLLKESVSPSVLQDLALCFRDLERCAVGHSFLDQRNGCAVTKPFETDGKLSISQLISQALQVLRNAAGVKSVASLISECLVLPLDLLEWHLRASQHLLPKTVAYDVLSLLLKDQSGLARRIATQESLYGRSLAELVTPTDLPTLHAVKHSVMLRFAPSASCDDLPLPFALNGGQLALDAALSWVFSDVALVTTSVTSSVSQRLALSTVSQWMKHDATSEYYELLQRFDAATRTIADILPQLGYLKTPLPLPSTAATASLTDIHQGYCCLSLPHVAVPALQTMQRHGVLHWAVEAVLMYLEDLNIWEITTSHTLECLRMRQERQHAALAGFKQRASEHTAAVPQPSEAFNSWGLRQPSALNSVLIQAFWDAYGMSSALDCHQPTLPVTHHLGFPRSLVSYASLKTLQLRGEQLHCAGVKGQPCAALQDQLNQVVQALHVLEAQGQRLVEKATSVVASRCVSTTPRDAGSEGIAKGKRKGENVGGEQETTKTALAAASALIPREDIEMFLQQSLFADIPCHGLIKDLLRRSVELETLASHVFLARSDTAGDEGRVTVVTWPAPRNYASVFPQAPPETPTEQQDNDHGDVVRKLPRQELVFLVFKRVQVSFCPVESSGRLNILRQCWICAARFVLHGYALTTLTSERPSSGAFHDAPCHLDHTPLPLKLVQALYIASRKLFKDAAEEQSSRTPPELEIFKLLLATAKRLLLEARSSVEAWIRLRIIASCYPVDFHDEMRVLQNKLHEKFPSMSLHVVSKHNDVQEIQVYRNKLLKTRYIPLSSKCVEASGTGLSASACAVKLPADDAAEPQPTQQRVSLIGKILNAFRRCDNADVVRSCTTPAFNSTSITLKREDERLQERLRRSARKCFCVLFPDDTAAAAEDRERTLFETTEAQLNNKYFEALEDMVLKRLQQCISVRRVTTTSNSLLTDVSSSSTEKTQLLPSTAPPTDEDPRLARSFGGVSSLASQLSSISGQHANAALDLLLAPRATAAQQGVNQSVEDSSLERRYPFSTSEESCDPGGAMERSELPPCVATVAKTTENAKAPRQSHENTSVVASPFVERRRPGNGEDDQETAETEKSANTLLLYKGLKRVGPATGTASSVITSTLKRSRSSSDTEAAFEAVQRRGLQLSPPGLPLTLLESIGFLWSGPVAMNGSALFEASNFPGASAAGKQETVAYDEATLTPEHCAAEDRAQQKSVRSLDATQEVLEQHLEEQQQMPALQRYQLQSLNQQDNNFPPFLLWIVPVFSPIPTALCLSLRGCQNAELVSTMSVAAFAEYINPLYDAQKDVALLNVIVGANYWNSKQLTGVIGAADTVSMESHPKLLSAARITRCLRLSKTVVYSSVPKPQLPVQDVEALEREALGNELRVLCFDFKRRERPTQGFSKPSTENAYGGYTTPGHETATNIGFQKLRLWVVPPEPLVTEPLLSSHIPKSSQLVFGVLEVPRAFCKDPRHAAVEDAVKDAAVVRNVPLGGIRAIAAEVMQSLATAATEKDKARQYFSERQSDTTALALGGEPEDAQLLPTGLRIALPPTLLHWTVMNQKTVHTIEEATASCLPLTDFGVTLPPLRYYPANNDNRDHCFQDTTLLHTENAAAACGVKEFPATRQSDESGMPASGHLVGNRIPKRTRLQQHTMTEAFPRETRFQQPSVAVLATAQQTTPSLGVASPVIAPPQCLLLPANPVVGRSDRFSSIPPWQQHHTTPSNYFQNVRSAVLPSDNNAPASGTTCFAPDPYSSTTTTPAQQQESVQPWRAGAPGSTRPPWQQKSLVAAREKNLPFTVPEALKSLLQNAAAELRQKRQFPPS